MKTFVAILVVLIGFTLIAWRWQPEETKNKRVLIWVSDDNPARRAQIALFNKLNPDLELRLDPANSSVEKVIVQSLGGVGPDLFDCGSGGDLATYVQSGIAWDITDQLPKLGFDPRRDAWPGIRPMSTLDNHVYGFGCNATADAIWYNKAIFDQEHVPYPKGELTWDEFRALAKRMTHRDAMGRVDRFGFLADWWNWMNFTDTFGGAPYTPDLKRSTLDSPPNVAAIQLVQNLIYRDKVTSGPVEDAAMATQGGWGSGIITVFGAGKGAMAMGGRWWLTTLRDYPGLRLGVILMPKGVSNSTRCYGRATLINVRSPHRKDALRFLKYQASREYSELVNSQADGMGPSIRFDHSEGFLHDPKYPNEVDNAVWLAALERSIADQPSPYVSADVVQRLITKQLDLVRANEKSPDAALHDATVQINAKMDRELADNPSLKARYEAAK